MRIIAGEFKGTNLSPVPGDQTRPTTDFFKEAMFSVLQDCEVSKAADLFAGSGALGLEALSRGTGNVDLVDFSRRAQVTMAKNIEKLHCAPRCRCIKQKVSTFLHEQTEPYDLIFMDPPYCEDLVNPTIELVIANNLLSPEGRLVVEHSVREPLRECWNEYIEFQKRYGETMLTILSQEQS